MPLPASWPHVQPGFESGVDRGNRCQLTEASARPLPRSASSDPGSTLVNIAGRVIILVQVWLHLSRSWNCCGLFLRVTHLQRLTLYTESNRSWSCSAGAVEKNW